jgi:hypothetical protein
MSIRKLLSLLSSLSIVAVLAASSALANSPTPLAQKMDVMAAALKNLQHPGVPPAAANPLDDLKQLKDAAIDCRDHSDDLAPAAVAADPQARQGFHAEFVTLVTKVEALEAALQLPADADGRDAKIKGAIADILAVKKYGHSKYNN